MVAATRTAGGPGGPGHPWAPGRALAIYAHPDDPDVSCGGTIASWASAGTEIHVCVCCDGDKGSAQAEAGGRPLVERRRREVEAAGRALGVAAHYWFGYPDGEIEDTASLRGRLVELVRRVRPDVVLAPDPTAVFFGSSYVNHRDHRVVGWAVLDAVSPASSSPLYFPGSGAAFQVGALYLSSTLEPDTWVDISDCIDTKAAALACHTSQIGEGGEWLRNVVREQAAEAGQMAGVAYAEAFRKVTLV